MILLVLQIGVMERMHMHCQPLAACTGSKDDHAEDLRTNANHEHHELLVKFVRAVEHNAVHGQCLCEALNCLGLAPPCFMCGNFAISSKFTNLNPSLRNVRFVILIFSLDF